MNGAPGGAMRLYEEAWRGPYVLLPLLPQPNAVVRVGGVALAPSDWVDPDVLLWDERGAPTGTPRAFLSIRDGTMPPDSTIDVVPVARRRVAMRVRDLLARDAGGERITYLPQAAAVVRRRDGTRLAGAALREGHEPWRVGARWVAGPQYRELVPVVPSGVGAELQAWNVLRGATGDAIERAPDEESPWCPARRAPPLAERS